MIKKIIFLLCILWATPVFACHVNPKSVCEDDFENFRSWKICNTENNDYYVKWTLLNSNQDGWIFVRKHTCEPLRTVTINGENKLKAQVYYNGWRGTRYAVSEYHEDDRDCEGICFGENTCEECENPVTLDLDQFQAGTFIDNQFYSQYGLTIWGTKRSDANASKDVITFDSAYPTGGDCDLGAPSQTYGGPGCSNNTGNDSSLGNLLIISEDSTDANGDGLVDDPDDEGSGGRFYFQFNDFVSFLGATFVDIEESC
jgi:hypothetical protein